MRSEFTHFFLRINQIDPAAFRRWLFRPGMRYRDNYTWWGDGKLRPSPHEGLDLLSFQDNNGTSFPLTERTDFPPLFEGTVRGIFDDLLGKSIHLTHTIFSESKFQLHSLYGHTIPASTLKIDTLVNKKTSLGHLAPGRGGQVPPHLHITTFWSPIESPPTSISWTTINTTSTIALCDPLTFIQRTKASD